MYFYVRYRNLQFFQVIRERVSNNREQRKNNYVIHDYYSYSIVSK
jgi:hypothetical protein